jgi:hypothetical protein
MEVDDQSQRYIEPFPVAEQLRLVDGVNLFDSLHFDKQANVNQQIETKRYLPAKLFVADDYLVLFLHGVAPPLKFPREAPLVDRLKESRSFVLVDLNGGTDDVVDA